MARDPKPEQPWGDVFPVPEERKPPTETVSKTFIEKTVSMEPRRDPVVHTIVLSTSPVNAKVWLTITRWVCVTAFAIFFVKAVCWTIGNFNDNHAVEYIATLGVELHGSLPHLPDPDEKSPSL